MADDGVRPFANGTEYEAFCAENCWCCTKWSGDSVSPDCEIDAALVDAYFTSGTVTAEIGRRMGYPALAYHPSGIRYLSWKCPEFEESADASS